MPVEFYHFYLSQHSRSVQTLLLLGKIPHNVHIVNLFKQEHKTEEFLKISKTGAIPVIVDDNITLFESNTILKYLARKYNLEQYYPSDIVLQAKLDQYLDWHHTGTRQITYNVGKLYFAQKWYGAPIPDNKDELLKEMDWKVQAFEEIFLENGKNEFILGFQNPTIGDILAINELTYLFMLRYDFTKHPHLLAYIKRLLIIPEIKQVNQAMVELINTFAPDISEEYKKLFE